MAPSTGQEAFYLGGFYCITAATAEEAVF